MGNWSRFFSLRRQTPAEQPTSARRSMYLNSGVYVDEESSMQVSGFYRGVMYISTQIAKLPWDIKDAGNTVLDKDPISFLLNVAANREMSAYNFKLYMIQQAIIRGNAYAEIERDMIGRPVALWPLPIGAVEPYRDMQTGILYYRARSGSKWVYLDLKDIFHVKNFHTKDGLVGQGVVEYARESLGISLGGDRMASGIFANAGLPSGVLKSEKTLSDAAYTRLKDSWREQYSGKKSGAVAILEDGVQFEAIKIDAQVLQFLESRKFGVLEVARFLGLPPTKLFDTSGATFSNVENANLEVATDTLDSWTVNLELEADVKLLSNRYGGKFSEIDLYSVFRGDAKTRVDYYSRMMQSGAMSPNEIRNKEGMAPVPEGDRRYIAVNNFTPADRVDEVIDAQVEGGKDNSAGQPEKPDTNTDTVAAELERAAITYLTRK